MTDLDWWACPHNDEIYAALKANIAEAQGDEHYVMSLVGDDARAFVAAYNQGIDSHLEAITVRSEWMGARLRVWVHPAELPTLVRRLFEGDDNAHSLASGILSTLGMETV